MINLFTVNMPEEVDKPLLEVLHSGYIGQGAKVEEFEHEFGKYINNPNVVTVNSCTSALTLALRLAGVGPDDEVVTTAMTCSATNLPILSLGAKPVWADVFPHSGLIDPADVEEKITAKTKAIMAVDWGGLPCNYEVLMEIAKHYGIKVISDAAHSIGADYKKQKTGAVADYTCFSLQAIKHITTVDGGILTCLDPEDAKRAKTLRWFGIDRTAPAKDSRIDQDIEEWGWKFHMNDIAATIGLVQLKNLEKILDKHRHIAKYYDDNLSSHFIKPPRHPHLYNSSSWLYTIVLPTSELRDKFREFMESKGIATNPVHRRNDQYTVFKKYKNRKSPGLDAFSEGNICIPIHNNLSDEDVNSIVTWANFFAGKYMEYTT